jgi:ubiquinone/menaquinone biosynthesis C-methylase UbiE
MAHFKFDIAKIAKLDDPGRFEQLKPAAMWEALGCPVPRVIVDVGAGTGIFAAAFSRLAPGARVYAADTEDAMLEWMREHRSEVEDGRVVPIKAEETGLPLGDAVADLVTMVNVHHELEQPASTYREAARVLKPGGQVLIVDWKPEDTPKGPPAAVRASAETLEGFLRDAGFGDIVSHEVLPWHSVVTGTKIG